MEMAFSKGLELPSMDVLLQFVNAAFFMGLLSWLFIEFLRRRRDNGGDVPKRYRVAGGVANVFRVITVLCNVIISVSYLGFGFYEYWSHRIFSFKSFTLFLTWVLATVVVIYAKNYTTLRDHKIRRWPLVLILWWVFSFFCNFLSVLVYLLVHLGSIEVPHILPEASPVEFIYLPLLTLLCFNALPGSCNRNLSDLEHPFLQKENQHSSRDANSFANARVWSKLTFHWLNPLFKRGRTQKLELSHIPSIPQSETAENASLLLEESLRKRKMESSSLPKVMIYTVWKSLAINAVLAGTPFVSWLLFKL